MWKSNNKLLKTNESKNESKVTLENIFICLKTKHNKPELTGCNENAQREIHSSKNLHWKRRFQVNNLNFQLEKLKFKKEQTKPKISRKKKIIKIKELTSIFIKFFPQKKKRCGLFLTHSMKPALPWHQNQTDNKRKKSTDK